MSGFIRKRRASPPHDFSQKKRPTDSTRWFCCKCVAAKQKDRHGNCLLCGHLSCQTCKTVHGMVSANYEQDNRNAISRTQEYQIAGDALYYPGLSQMPRQNLLEERTVFLEEPQVEQTELPERLHQGRPKRPKLSRFKCERCRHDKKKCLPEDRGREERCERCIEKDFPCAEGTRATRTGKLALKPPAAMASGVSTVTDSVPLEERLKQWVFLAGYCNMMTMAQRRLEKLFNDLKAPFILSYGLFSSKPYRDFVDFVEETLRTTLLRCTKAILSMGESSKALPMWFLPVSLRSTLLSIDPIMVCTQCNPEGSELMTKGLGDPLDADAGFLAQQHQIEYHYFDMYELHASEEEKAGHQKRERECSEKLSSEFLEQAGMIVDSFAGSETAALVKELGLYHSDIEDRDRHKCYPESRDCLGRTKLHRIMDGVRKSEKLCYLQLSNLGIGANERYRWSEQDILGRTPLHIVCQPTEVRMLGALVKQMLDLGADPRLATTCGHIPLHFAAARGSVEACSVLLEHESTFNIGAKDVKGRTALDYATIKKHQDVVDLLSARYAEAGLNEDLERARIIQEQVNLRL